MNVLKRWLLLGCLLVLACRDVDSASDGVLTVDEDSFVGQSLAGETEAGGASGLVVPTQTVVATATAVSAQSPTAAPVLATETAVSTQPPNGFPPGSQATFPLNGGELISFRFDGTQFEPLLFFAEASDGLDVVLQIYEGEHVANAPLREANFSGVGLPELLLFSPEVSGRYQVAVAAVTGGGEVRLSVFDGSVRETAVSQHDTLAAGESRAYQVASANGRSVLAFVDPVEQADLAIQFALADGTVLAASNFGGTGAAEAAYVLPLQPTNYAITVSEVSGAAATYDVVIVILE